jgi:hypothetical protein
MNRYAEIMARQARADRLRRKEERRAAKGRTPLDTDPETTRPHTDLAVLDRLLASKETPNAQRNPTL